MSMTRTDPTILFLNRMDRYRTTGDAWMFFVKRYYHVPGIAARCALTPIDWRVVLSLDARSFGEITIPDDKLIDWYGRFGFRETVSDTLESGMPMARFPA
jgi:hypothetical protein